MFCSNCGKELTENDKFCAHCGRKINDTKDKDITGDTISNNIVEQTVENNGNANTNLEKAIKVNNNTTNINDKFSKVVITRLEGSKLFNRTPMKIIYNGGIITKIVAGEVLELEFPVGQHSVIFDANGDVQDYKINVEKANSTIYIDISLISNLAHSSGIPEIQSIRSEDNIVPVNANHKFTYNEILNSINNSTNSNSSYMGMYGIASVICIIIGLFVMGYAMSLTAIAFGFLGMRRTKVLNNEKGDFLSLIGIIGGCIEFAVMLTQSFTF